ncbi:MAG: [protein-PII] uridylyltransferase [Polyangiaceae bacterium]|nr:[protein-PII] uridylyltransferase [Polyangiaceae bacterium]
MQSEAPSAPPGPLLAEKAPGLVSELRRYVARHRAEFTASVLDNGHGLGMDPGRQYARACDGLLNSLLHVVQAATPDHPCWPSVSLAGVGSYGRGALSLHSDLDVRLLCGGDLAQAQPVAEALLYPLWDAGMPIGHQVVSSDQMLELAQHDLPTATTLLDWRTVAGERGPAAQMLDRAFEGLFGIGRIRDFLDRLEERSVEREERYGDSIYLLEPDVRNGPGGLRDMDVAQWAARARWRVRSLRDLVRVGILVPREWAQIESAANLMWHVRNLLHIQAGRRMDRLSYDRQEQTAEQMGYAANGEGVERFMSEYYRQARVLAQAREMVFSRAQPPPTRKPHEQSIGKGLKLINGQITMAHPGSLENDPALALRLYVEALERNVPVYPFARNTLARVASLPAFGERLRASAEAARLFVRLCMHVPRTQFKGGSVLRELHDIGLLLAVVPEFAPVVGRVHHDVYHVYTVDIHSIGAVDRLRALTRGELAGPHPLASRLAAEVARPQVLFLSVLLHDIGKDIGGSDHSVRGAVLAAKVAERLGMAPADVDEIRHLVRRHLRMYHVATRRDVDDPATLAEFAQEVRGHEGLKELYLLTIADVSTTSPTALTSWKARMLEELYVATERSLGEGSGPENESVSSASHQVLDLVAGGEQRWFAQEFLAAMPERYVYANSPDAIARHAALAQQALEKRAVVACLSTDGFHLELAFVAEDRPGLLAMITATLAAANVSVVGAQVYSWLGPDEKTRAFDVFWVAAGNKAGGVDRLVSRLEDELGRLIDGEVEPAELVAARLRSDRSLERPTPAVHTVISVDNRAATSSTVLEVTTQDAPGLLFRLANTLQRSGLRISLAKINTEGTLVADVFYVTDENGAKLADPARVEQLKRRILTALGGK